MSSMASQIRLYARLVQAVFMGVLLLGASLMIGEYAEIVSVPFSELSVSTTVYGFLGMVACEYVARRFGREEKQ